MVLRRCVCRCCDKSFVVEDLEVCEEVCFGDCRKAVLVCESYREHPMDLYDLYF